MNKILKKYSGLIEKSILDFLDKIQNSYKNEFEGACYVLGLEINRHDPRQVEQIIKEEIKDEIVRERLLKLYKNIKQIDDEYLRVYNEFSCSISSRI